jgi:DNA-binding transcriptional ArsR family regulator
MLTDPSVAADASLRRIRDLHRALGDLTRLRIITLLAEFGPMPVRELSSRVVLSQPLISWHLRILRLAGFIDAERHGREVICRLRPSAFAELHAADQALLSGGSHPVSTLGPAEQGVTDVG